MKLRYRIREVKYKHHSEYWVEKAIRLFGIPIYWYRTSLSYYSNIENAKKEIEDMVSNKTEIHYPRKK